MYLLQQFTLFQFWGRSEPPQACCFNNVAICFRSCRDALQRMSRLVAGDVWRSAGCQKSPQMILLLSFPISSLCPVLRTSTATLKQSLSGHVTVHVATCCREMFRLPETRILPQLHTCVICALLKVLRASTTVLWRETPPATAHVWTLVVVGTAAPRGRASALSCLLLGIQRTIATQEIVRATPNTMHQRTGI